MSRPRIAAPRLAAPSLSVAAGFTYWALLARLPHEARARGWAVVLGAFIVGPLVMAQAADIGQVLRWRLWPGNSPGSSPSELVAAQLNAIRRPSDTLFTWEYLPRISLATDMRSPTRQLDGHYLYDFRGSATEYGDELWRTRSPGWRCGPTSANCRGDNAVAVSTRDASGVRRTVLATRSCTPGMRSATRASQLSRKTSMALGSRAGTPLRSSALGYRSVRRRPET
jgi:hypothetical protein